MSVAVGCSIVKLDSCRQLLLLSLRVLIHVILIHSTQQMELFYILLERRLAYVCFDATKKKDLAEFYGWKLNATKYEGNGRYQVY
jgi:hypothetical protein